MSNRNFLPNLIQPNSPTPRDQEVPLGVAATKKAATTEGIYQCHQGHQSTQQIHHWEQRQHGQVSPGLEVGPGLEVIELWIMEVFCWVKGRVFLKIQQKNTFLGLQFFNIIHKWLKRSLTGRVPWQLPTPSVHFYNSMTKQLSWVSTSWEKLLKLEIYERRIIPVDVSSSDHPHL